MKKYFSVFIPIVLIAGSAFAALGPVMHILSVGQINASPTVAAINPEEALGLASIAPPMPTGSIAEGSCYDFSKAPELRVKDGGQAIVELQNALAKDGSASTDLMTQERAKFGDLTAASLVGFQEKYSSEILAAHVPPLPHGTGYLDKLTKAKLQNMYGCDKAITYYYMTKNGCKKASQKYFNADACQANLAKYSSTVRSTDGKCYTDANCSGSAMNTGNVISGQATGQTTSEYSFSELNITNLYPTSATATAKLQVPSRFGSLTGMQVRFYLVMAGNVSLEGSSPIKTAPASSMPVSANFTSLYPNSMHYYYADLFNPNTKQVIATSEKKSFTTPSASTSSATSNPAYYYYIWNNNGAYSCKQTSDKYTKVSDCQDNLRIYGIPNYSGTCYKSSNCDGKVPVPKYMYYCSKSDSGNICKKTSQTYLNLDQCEQNLVTYQSTAKPVSINCYTDSNCGGNCK